MADALLASWARLLSGVYDCVDRIVLNAYVGRCYGAGGFRLWWRSLYGCDDGLTNAALTGLAGRFSRRVRAWARRAGVPVLDCDGKDRKHDIAEQYLREHPPAGPGVFLVMVARAPAPVWQARRYASGGLWLTKKLAYVNHYSFHILDQVWGHLTIKMSGYPPFGAQVIFNGHEYVAQAARAAGIGFAMQGNCFTEVTDPPALAGIAAGLAQDGAVEQLRQACDRWIYTACLCFGLDLDEQARTGFEYGYSVYQLEYSRNLIFRLGGQMQQLFDRVVDRARTRLDIPVLNTIFGTVRRPTRTPTDPDPVTQATQTPHYGLTMFQLRYGPQGVKAYTKAERLLRLEAVIHNAKRLPGVRRYGLDRFPDFVAQLSATVDRFATTLDCVDTAFLPEDTLDQLPQPGQLGATRVGGIDLNKPRARTALHAALALSAAPAGFTVAQLAAQVNRLTGRENYTTRQAAYDLKKMRAKHFIDQPRSRRYRLAPLAARTIAALLALREHVLAPILAGVRRPGPGRPPAHRTSIDRAYQTLRENLLTLLQLLGIHLSPPAAA